MSDNVLGEKTEPPFLFKCYLLQAKDFQSFFSIHFWGLFSSTDEMLSFWSYCHLCGMNSHNSRSKVMLTLRIVPKFRLRLRKRSPRPLLLKFFLPPWNTVWFLIWFLHLWMDFLRLARFIACCYRSTYWSTTIQVDVSRTFSADQFWFRIISGLFQRCPLTENLWTALIQLWTAQNEIFQS